MQIPHRLRRLTAALLPIALCALLQPVAAAERTQAANLVNVFAFGSPPEGLTDVPKSPRSDLLLADDGNIYFAGSAGGKGYGAVGRMAFDENGNETVSVVYAFANAQEGLLPFGAIMQASDGNLYGTTLLGGEKSGGTVYKLTLSGQFTRLHQFDNGDTDPHWPHTGLAEADGNLYGTTRLGGAFKKGTVFRISTSGVFTVIHSFNGDDGQEPQGRLVLDSDGRLYGTTMMGGANNRGVIYRISTSGEFQLLYSFPRANPGDPLDLVTNPVGANPKAGLVRTADGVFYGTAQKGGTAGWGTLFRATINGDSADVEAVHSFKGWAFDAGAPQSVPVLGPDGSFYGTSEYGGYDSDGAVWKITPDGVATLLHSFSGNGLLVTGGAQPVAGVLFANGGLYGVTATDGVYGAGHIYRLELEDDGALPLDLTVSAKQVQLDEPVVISWSAPAAVECDKFGSWNEPADTGNPNHITPVSGTETVIPFVPTVYTYGLACKDAAGVINYAYAAIEARAPPQESVDGGKIIGGGALSWLLLALLAALLFVKLIKETRSSCP